MPTKLASQTSATARTPAEPVRTADQLSTALRPATRDDSPTAIDSPPGLVTGYKLFPAGYDPTNAQHHRAVRMFTIDVTWHGHLVEPDTPTPRGAAR